MKRRPGQKIYCLRCYLEFNDPIVVACIREGVIWRTVYKYQEIEEIREAGPKSNETEVTEFYNMNSIREDGEGESSQEHEDRVFDTYEDCHDALINLPNKFHNIKTLVEIFDANWFERNICTPVMRSLKNHIKLIEKDEKFFYSEKEDKKAESGIEIKVTVEKSLKKRKETEK